MKLERFRSDWNGQKSDEAYFDIPKPKLVKQALLSGAAESFGSQIVLAKDGIVEVRTRIQNGLNTGNVYRDLYRIKD